MFTLTRLMADDSGRLCKGLGSFFLVFAIWSEKCHLGGNEDTKVKYFFNEYIDYYCSD